LGNCSYDQTLIKAKCHPPRITEQRVLRRDLSEKLAGALDHQLTIVTAPAGYGKSTAVVDWLGMTGLPVAWVSLDANDNHPEVFWRYICLALDGILGGVGEAISYCLSSPELLKTNTHLHILIDQLSAGKNEIILTLDDFHLITIPEILKSFSYFVNYLPSHVHLILISRTEPGMKLTKLRLSGGLLRIGFNDLRFQTGEIAQFYQVKGLTFEREELDRIEQYTGGWAAALVAVAMDPEAGRNCERRDLNGKLSRSELLIDKFLEEELLSKWPEQKRNFLLKTSILESLCGPLCDAVTGLSGSSEILRGIWLQNEFLIAMDAENCWYRYHPLFDKFLRKLLAKQAGSSFAGLHLKAARWYQESGLTSPAMDHYLQAGRFDAAVQLIKSQWGLLFARGEYSRLFLWLQQIPEKLIQNHPEIIALQVRFYTDNNLLNQAEKCLERLMELVQDSGGPMTPQIQKSILLVEAYLLLSQGKLAEILTKLKAVMLIDGVDATLSCNYVDFNLSEISLYRCRAGLGAIHFFKSDPEAYWHMMSDYRKMLTQYPGFGPLAVGEYYYETNRPDDALPYLAVAVDEAVKSNCPGALVPTMLTIARVKRNQNEITAAFDAVRECEKRLTQTNRPHWNYLLNAFRARLDLEVGRTEALEEWFLSSKLQIYQEITKTNEYELLVFARILMSQERFGDAVILLERLLTFAEAEQRLHSMVEVLNLMAVNTAQTGDLNRAMELLNKSLAIGLEQGYFRSFVDEFAPMRALLEQYLFWAKERTETADNRGEQLLTYATALLAAIQKSPFKTAFMTQKCPAVLATIQCFGSFVIYREGHPVVCKNSKAREILAYLVHNQGTPVGWEKIVETVWPDCHYESAHRNFHATMYLLRKFLDNHSLLEILDCSRGNYRIRPEKIDCDAYEFSRFYADYSSDPSDPNLTEAAKRLFTGGYFEEDGFAWAYAKAAQLERMAENLQNENV
jgi:LuxR family maltose regulon positive regulatory protein